jgi:hypothetical protein
MQFSRHAITRSQQRSISTQIADLVVLFGQPRQKRGNAFEYTLKEKEAVKLISELKHAIQLLEKARNKAVLVSGEGDTVITMYVSK